MGTVTSRALKRGTPQPPEPATANGLAALHFRLRAATSVADLFRLGAQEACAAYGFERGVVASIDGTAVTAEGRRLASAGEDDLARRLIAAPVEIEPGTLESQLLRNPGWQPGPRTRSTLAEALGLEHFAVVPVAPEGRTVALLVVDRVDEPASAAELRGLTSFAVVLGIALERLVLRGRVEALSTEVRQLAMSAQALADEALTAPVSPRPGAGRVTLFTQAGYLEERAALPDEFSERDAEIAELLCAGRTNSEIGAELFLSPETVKDQVARLVRKLGACNRVEAAARFAAMRAGAAR